MQDTLEKPAIDAGEILYADWGFEQTNVDFYRVEKLANGFATLQKIAGELVEYSDETMTGRKQPAFPDQPIGAPIRRKVRELGDGRQFVQLETYAYGYAWNGQPRRFSSYA